MGPYRIVFAGPIGAGKTTAIQALSDIPPISTEVASVFRDALALGLLTIVPGLAPGGQASTVVLVTNDDVQMVRRGRIQESELAGPLAAIGSRKM